MVRNLYLLRKTCILAQCLESCLNKTLLLLYKANKIDKNTYDNLRAIGSKPGKLYGKSIDSVRKYINCNFRTFIIVENFVFIVITLVIFK